MKTAKKSSKLLAMLLVLAMVFTVAEPAFMVSALADDAEPDILIAPLIAPAPAATATFENTSDDGEDQISLAAARSFKATFPLTEEQAAAFESDSLVVSLDRDEAKQYVDPALYPNQSKGGELSGWLNQNNEPFFENVEASVEDGKLVVTFDTNCFFWSKGAADPSATGSGYLDVCGYFDLNAALDGETVGSVAVKVAPYDEFHTMAEIYEEIDDMEAFAAANTDLYVEKCSMGTSSGIIYDPLDMPYLLVADDEASVKAWLEFTELAETDPDTVLDKIANGELNDIRVPVLFSNIHANEVAASDGIIDFAWMLLNAAAADGSIDYDVLTGFTAEGEAQLKAEMEANGIHVPDLVADASTYLGYLQVDNDKLHVGTDKGKSGVIDFEKYYTVETKTVNVDELLKDVFFIIVPEENVEGRTYISRAASNGYDLNRDNSFQTTPETANMQKLIGTFNPVSFTEFHGRHVEFQCEPCDPPHEPNFEYDLLAEHLIPGGEAMGIAAVANNDTFNSYSIPQRDYLYSDENGDPYWEPWDDMSTSYTPQFAMLQGTVAYTVELPAYNDAAAKLVSYGILGQSDYVAGEKLGYLTAQAKIYQRGVKNFNSDAYELVGQWFADQADVEGAEMELFRPEYEGNGNFYPECYIIPMDGENQTNLQAAYDMMIWLSRNDVKVLLTEKPFTYDGVTYPAGTAIISMYQAKRSVANGALYNGTLIQSWSDLYSEGITAFNKTRGFDMITVADPEAFKTIDAACGEWMDYEDCVKYVATLHSYFSGVEDKSVILSNASVDSVAAVNALLKSGKTVSMVTDEDSEFYGDFALSYEDWQTVATEYVLTGTGVAELPAAEIIYKAPTVYVAGASADNTSGFLYSSRVSNANWNYDRVAMTAMGFTTTDDPAEADVILGASALNDAAKAAVLSGKPYIGYGSSAAGKSNVLGEAVTRASVSGGMDCLGYVTYPTTSLVNASYVMDEDNILYGYGVGYFTAIPDGAEVLVKMDGSKTPLEGFIPAITGAQQAACEDYIGSDSIQAISYKNDKVNVTLFANSLTHKGHQTDEYAFISNFIFSNLLGGKSSAFTDLDRDEWYMEAVDYCVDNDIMNGVSDNYFAPKSNATRAMFVTMLARFADVDTTTGETWDAVGTEWAVEQEISDGLNMSDDITREQIVTMLYRYATLKGYDVSVDENTNFLSFNDFFSVSDWATAAMEWALTNGIIIGDGVDNLDLRPGDLANRAEIAMIFMRFCKLG